MAVPGFVTDSAFAVQSSHDPIALFRISALALAANIAVRAAALPRSLVGVALGDMGLLVSSARQEILRIRAVLDGVQPEW